MRPCLRAREFTVIRIFKHHVPRLAFLALLMEILLLLTVSGPAPAGAAVLCLAALGWYQPDLCAPWRDAIKHALARTVPAMLLSYLLAWWLLAGSGSATSAATAGSAAAAAPWRGVPLDMVAFVLACIGMTMLRLVLAQCLWHPAFPASLHSERLILLGDGALAQECARLAAGSRGFHRLQVVGCVPAPDMPSESGFPCGLPRLQGATLRELARRHGADEIVISLKERRGGALPLGELLECTLHGLRCGSRWHAALGRQRRSPCDAHRALAAQAAYR